MIYRLPVLTRPGAIRNLRSVLDRFCEKVVPVRHTVNCVACDRGVSAVEFSLLAPVLVLSLLGTANLGFGVGDRIGIEHVLRAGAQSAITDPGTAAVKDVMDGAAETSFSLADSANPGSTPLTLNAIRFCACPETPNTAVACLTICAASAPTYIYYRVSAQKTFAMLSLAPINFDRSIQVQIR